MEPSGPGPHGLVRSQPLPGTRGRLLHAKHHLRGGQAGSVCTARGSVASEQRAASRGRLARVAHARRPPGALTPEGASRPHAGDPGQRQAPAERPGSTSTWRLCQHGPRSLFTGDRPRSSGKGFSPCHAQSASGRKRGPRCNRYLERAFCLTTRIGSESRQQVRRSPVRRGPLLGSRPSSHQRSPEHIASSCRPQVQILAPMSPEDACSRVRSHGCGSR